jgi:hypothetical protein
VLEGVSARGLAVSRGRLVELYRACGMDPHSGDEIHPSEIEGAELEVRVRHEDRDGQIRLRVVGYRGLPGELEGDALERSGRRVSPWARSAVVTGPNTGRVCPRSEHSGRVRARKRAFALA